MIILNLKTGREFSFHQNQITITNLPELTNEDNGIFDLSCDALVSKNHGHIYREKDKWFIEDCGSTNGTRVDGKQIEINKPYELQPAMDVQTGETFWTIVPDNWIYFHNEGYFLVCKYSPLIGYCLFHCGTSLVGPAIIRNIGTKEFGAKELEIRIHEYSDSFIVYLGNILPGKRRTVKIENIPLRVERLRLQGQASVTTIDFIFDSQKKYQKTIVLGYNSWPYFSSAIKCLAAFVAPENEIVKNTVAGITSDLDRRTGIPTITMYLKQADRYAEESILHGIYNYIENTFQISYKEPALLSTPDLAFRFQNIRTAQEMVSIKKGTCIDIALFVASCLERIGLCPLIFLVGTRKNEPEHAFSGCWAGRVPGVQPLSDDKQRILEDVCSRKLFVIESSALLRKGTGSSPPTVLEAATNAIEKIKSFEWLCVIDVKALRPPNGSIVSIEHPYDAEVASIYEEARHFACIKKKRAIETIDLFYGILSSKGQVCTEVMNALSRNIDDILTKIENVIPVSDFEGEPELTENVSKCRRLAEANAWESGIPFVREEDLWWALIRNWYTSMSLSDICAREDINISPELLEKVLRQFYPREGRIQSGRYS